MDVYAIQLNDTTTNPLARVNTISSLLNVIIPLLTIGAALIFLAMLIVGAFTFLTAGGSPEKMKKAQGTLFAAVLGIFVVVCAYLVVKLLAYFFNVQIPI
jgi:uncharacterized membrane protein